MNMHQVYDKAKYHVEQWRVIGGLDFGIRRLFMIIRRRKFIPIPEVLRRGMVLKGLRCDFTEPHLIPFMRLPEGKSFIDVGANIGTHSIPFAAKGVLVHAFEPSPTARRILEEKAKEYNSIIIYPYALGSKEVSAQLFLHDCSSCDSLIHKATYFTGRTAAVKIKTLDSFNIQNVGIIKIDTEGYEEEVLLGSLETIKREKPRIILEVHEPLAKNGRRLTSILKSLGYSCFKVWKPPRTGQFHLIGDYKK